MPWRYRCYRFADEAAFTAARDALGESGASFAITGPLPAEEGAEPEPGYFVQAAWPGEPPAAWDEYLLPEPVPGMTVFAGWDEATPLPRQMTPLQFMEGLFTEVEQEGLATAALASPSLFLWWSKMVAAQIIDLDDPRMVEGLGVLVTAGLLTQARHDRILAALPPA